MFQLVGKTNQGFIHLGGGSMTVNCTARRQCHWLIDPHFIDLRVPRLRDVHRPLHLWGYNWQLNNANNLLR